VYPLSSAITVPPVKIAISSNIAFFDHQTWSFTAAIFTPRNLFTTKVDNASPSTSSASNNGFPDCATGSEL
jgi:hypothetical protein